MKTIPFLFLIEIFSLCKDNLFSLFPNPFLSFLLLSLSSPSSFPPLFLLLPLSPSSHIFYYFPIFPTPSPPLLSFTSLLLHFLLLLPSSHFPFLLIIPPSFSFISYFPLPYFSLSPPPYPPLSPFSFPLPPP